MILLFDITDMQVISHDFSSLKIKRYLVVPDCLVCLQLNIIVFHSYYFCNNEMACHNATETMREPRQKVELITNSLHPIVISCQGIIKNQIPLDTSGEQLSTVTSPDGNHPVRKSLIMHLAFMYNVFFS